MASVDGLVSGLNTSDIISQLMQLERQPQARLQTQKANVESAVTALRALNAKFTAISTAAGKLTAATGWQLTTATSSAPTRVSVTATAGAPQGGLTFSVQQLAAASRVLSSGSVGSLSTQVVAPNTVLKLAKGPTGTPVDIPTGDGSLSALMKAINDAGAGVSASAVQIQPGQYQLRLASTTTGAGTEATLTTATGTDPFVAGTLGTFGTMVAGANAKLTVGNQAVERASNTVSDLVPGLTLTLLKADAVDANGVSVEPPVSV